MEGGTRGHFAGFAKYSRVDGYKLADVRIEKLELLKIRKTGIFQNMQAVSVSL